jgi:MFS transporter, Spinster family, sphingosine-1-phosphate transporter
VKGYRFGATASLIVLFAINLANYMDRYLVIALQEPIRKEFKASDAEIGLLSFAFVIVYMLASPFCGYLADRIQRRFVIASAVALWSVATAAASRAANFFPQLLGLRAAVGIGESGYNAAGQALLTDLYTDDKRNRVMAFFNLAMPVGSALGYMLGGKLFDIFKDWRLPCLLVGAPGLLLAVVALFLPQPAPTAASAEAQGHGHGGGTKEAYLILLRDRVFMANALGFAMQSFVLGGLAQWAPPFLTRNHGMEVGEAAFLAGALVVVSGLVGTVAGALVGDAFAKRGRIVAYATVTGVGYLVAAPLLAVGLWLPEKNHALACLFLALVGAFLGTGPSNVAARAPVLYRASAFAMVVFILHLLGDATSPPAIGKVSDVFQAGGLGEGPALRRALFVTPVMLVLGAVFMFFCAWSGRDPAPSKSAEPAP